MRCVSYRSYTNKDRKDSAEVRNYLKPQFFSTTRIYVSIYVCCGFVGRSALRHLHSGTRLRENPYQHISDCCFGEKKALGVLALTIKDLIQK